MVGGESGELVLGAASGGVGEAGFAGCEVLGGRTALRCARDRVEEGAIGIHDVFGQGRRAERIGTGVEVGRSAFFDADEENGARIFAADGLDARGGDSGDLLEAVFKIALRRRKGSPGFREIVPKTLSGVSLRRP